jgi:hypothetical protein
LRVVSSLSKNRAGEATVFIRSENEGLIRGCMVLVIEVALQPRFARGRAAAQGEATGRPGDETSPSTGHRPARSSVEARVPGSAREHEACNELARTFRCGPSRVRSM